MSFCLPLLFGAFGCLCIKLEDIATLISSLQLFSRELACILGIYKGPILELKQNFTVRVLAFVCCSAIIGKTSCDGHRKSTNKKNENVRACLCACTCIRRG